MAVSGAIRKRGLLVFLSVCLLMLFPARLYIYAAEPAAAKEGIDAILLIDTSGSMRYSDGERTALEAAQLFIDMMETRNSRIGVVAFTDELQAVMPLTPINSPSGKEAIKNAVAGFEYVGYTDIGMSLKEAVSMLTADMNDANSPMIVLLTDGVIEIKPGQSARTVEMSYSDVLNALDTLSDQAPVYTIGLNHNDSVDIDLLRMISGQTLARNYIAEEAADLPLIFNEIFADHIRSSLTEVAAFTTDGEQYTDVTIPINSAFVAEANIIMLSSKPISDIKISNPSGDAVSFDGDKYTLSHANRYSMIKIVSPAEGDWVLSVKGLPNDHVTVNLIYNYNMDIAISAVQDGLSGPLYNPALPIHITASFISANPDTSFSDLYNETTAELRVYDENMALIESIAMRNTGASFAAEYHPDTVKDVRLAVSATHSNFEKISPFVIVAYEMPAASEPEPESEPTVTPSPEPEPAVTPTPEPTPALEREPTVEQTAEPSVSITPPEKSTPTAVYITLVAAALVVSALTLLVIRGRAKTRVFVGYMEVRAMMENGLYTSLDTPDLSTFAGQITLLEFFNASLSNKGLQILKVPVEIGDITMKPGWQNGQSVIIMKGRNRCVISDDDNNRLTQNKIIWRDNQRLTLSGDGSETKLEITYRAGGE